MQRTSQSAWQLQLLVQACARKPAMPETWRNDVAGKTARNTESKSCRSLVGYTIGIMGDLHLEPGNTQLHEEARQQFGRQLTGGGSRIVQLGDLGGYTSRPGSR